MNGNRLVTRRRVLQGAGAAAVAGFFIVPRHVLGGEGQIPPSETIGAALIGCGGRGGGTFGEVVRFFDGEKQKVVQLAQCDVKWVGQADNKTRYTDFRRVLERKDIDVVAIATPPHWHALISIAAAESGKDVLCEKPMTRTIGEGRAVVNAFKRYNRIFQVGTFGRLDRSRNRDSILVHKIMRSGLLKDNKGVYFHRGGLKVKEWSGKTDQPTREPPPNLDWNMYCGPSPLKPYTPTRVGGTHRWYWDYEGGGLSDMGQHLLDPVNWMFGKDDTSPVEVEASAPPAHAEVTGMWGWLKLRYADGFTMMIESGEWGEPSGERGRAVRLGDLSEADQAKIKEMPDPEPLLNFAQACNRRKPAGGNPEAAHRTSSLMHLSNIAIRVGRKIKYDPVKEQIIDDEEANRLVYQPMRSPWHV